MTRVLINSPDGPCYNGLIRTVVVRPPSTYPRHRSTGKPVETVENRSDVLSRTRASSYGFSGQTRR